MDFHFQYLIMLMLQVHSNNIQNLVVLLIKSPIYQRARNETIVCYTTFMRQLCQLSVLVRVSDLGGRESFCGVVT